MPFLPLSLNMSFCCIIQGRKIRRPIGFRDGTQNTGPSCSKLTTSLVNDSLKFQTLILQIHCYFLLKKCENPLQCSAKDSHIFSTKSNSVFVTLADICLTNLCLNDIVKLTML